MQIIRGLWVVPQVKSLFCSSSRPNSDNDDDLILHNITEYKISQ